MVHSEIRPPGGEALSLGTKRPSRNRAGRSNAACSSARSADFPVRRPSGLPPGRPDRREPCQDDLLLLGMAAGLSASRCCTPWSRRERDFDAAHRPAFEYALLSPARAGCVVARVRGHRDVMLPRHGRSPAPRGPRVGPRPVRDLPRPAVPARTLRHLRPAVPRSPLQPRRRAPVHGHGGAGLCSPRQDRPGRRPHRSDDRTVPDRHADRHHTPAAAMGATIGGSALTCPVPTTADGPLLTAVEQGWALWCIGGCSRGAGVSVRAWPGAPAVRPWPGRA